MTAWKRRGNAAVHAHHSEPQSMTGCSMFLMLAIVVIAALPCWAGVPGATCPGLERTRVTQLLADGNAAFEAGRTSEAEASWLKIRECAAGTSEWPKAVFNLGLLEYRRDSLHHLRR